MYWNSARVAIGKCRSTQMYKMARLTSEKEIAPVYYDLDSFEQGDIKRSLARAAEKKRRKEAIKGGR